MSIFKKVKSLKNLITGGAAKVKLDASQITFGSPFELVTSVLVDDADLKIDRAYIIIEGQEQVSVRNNTEGGSSTANTITTRLEVHVADSQTLTAGKSYEWTTTIQLPANAQPVYYGRNCQHAYVARVFLDCPGNDPDSGWIKLPVVLQREC